MNTCRSTIFSRKWCLFPPFMFLFIQTPTASAMGEAEFLPVCFSHPRTQYFLYFSQFLCTAKFTPLHWSFYVQIFHSLMFPYWPPTEGSERTPFPGLPGRHQSQETSPFLLIRETHQWHQFPMGRLDEPVLTASRFHTLVSSPRNLISMSLSALAYPMSDCHHRKNGCNFWTY